MEFDQALTRDRTSGGAEVSFLSNPTARAVGFCGLGLSSGAAKRMNTQPAGEAPLRISSAFGPDGSRAVRLDARMRSELADSLEYIANEVGSQRPDGDIARQVRSLQPVVRDLRQSPQRIRPALFSAYFRLVSCLTEPDEGDDAPEAVGDVLAAAQTWSNFRFSRFDADSLGGQRLLELYRRALDTDALQFFSFFTPTPEAVERAMASVTRALALMHRTAPDLAAEFKGLVTEVVFAAGSRDPESMHFDGASSYQLWGALALNVDECKSDLEMMETLAHEAGHSFLFGMTIDEPLVLNGDDDLYRSPLRKDPRPMDGIYHATWVSARMHYAMAAARDSGLLDAQQITQCEGFLCASRRAFEDGDSVVRANGKLSATGQALMSGARDFMYAAAS